MHGSGASRPTPRNMVDGNINVLLACVM